MRTLNKQSRDCFFALWAINLFLAGGVIYQGWYSRPSRELLILTAIVGTVSFITIMKGGFLAKAKYPVKSYLFTSGFALAAGRILGAAILDWRRGISVDQWHMHSYFAILTVVFFTGLTVLYSLFERLAGKRERP